MEVVDDVMTKAVSKPISEIVPEPNRMLACLYKEYSYVLIYSAKPWITPNMASATIDPLSFSYQIFMMTSCQNFWNGNEFDLIYLDFEKAFYKVEHNVVFQEMSNIGIMGVVRGGGRGVRRNNF